jgi:hypothetical protein
MSLPASALRAVQIGAEATYGTAVAANRKFSSLTLRMNPEVIDRELLNTIGNLVPTILQPGIELASGSLEGAVSFRELIYVFAGFLGDVTPNQIMDGSTATGAYRWQWQPASSSFTVPKSFTVEIGTQGQPRRSTGVLVSSLRLAIEKSKATISGDTIGSRLDAIAAFTANPTMLEPAVPDFTLSRLYMATTLSGLDSATAVGWAFKADVNFGQRFGRVIPIGLQRIGFVPQATKPQATLLVVDDSDGAAEIARFRNNDVVYMRIVLQGPVIYSSGSTTIRHELRLDMAAYYTGWQQDDAEDAAVIQLAAGMVSRSDLPGGYRVTVVTDRNAL